MVDPSRWEPVVEALRANGLEAELRVGFMEMRSIGVELGDGWSASIVSGTGNLDDFSSSQPIMIYVDGPGVPGEGYRVGWWPETTQVSRVAGAVAPLLGRLSTAAHGSTEDAAVGELEAGTAEEELRAMLAAVGARDAFDPAVVWRVFSTFALRPVSRLDPAADEDLVLFETGGREVNLMRQFDPGDDMEQLSCTLTVDSELPAATIWGPGGPAARAWIAEVEATQAHRSATSATVTSLEVDQSRV